MDLTSFQNGFRRGWAAGRENFIPSLFIQLLMAVLVVGYYRNWPTTNILTTLAVAKEKGGPLFAFLAAGFCGGVLSECCLVYFLQSGRWRRHNAENLLYKFILIGFGGFCAFYLYAGLALLLGNTASWDVILAKVCIDQFIYTLFFTCPLAAITSHWKNSGYRASAWKDLFTLEFIGAQVIPLLVTNWCFWGPAMILIYALPVALQLPLFLLAVAIWGLLLISVTARRHPELELN